LVNSSIVYQPKRNNGHNCVPTLPLSRKGMEKTRMTGITPFASDRIEFEEHELVCYCFRYTRKEIEQDYRQHHRSLILERIVLEKKRGACDCLRKNPKGR